MPPKRIAFLSNKLTLRGTEIAMYDYADYNETLLNNKSIIITRDYNLIKNQFDVSIDAYTKFKHRFEIVEYYQTQGDIDNIVIKYGISHIYIIKAGTWDGLISTKCKNLVHCVFNTSQPHGDFYCPVSSDVNKRFNTNYPVLPHMIRIDESALNLRNDLMIPDNATVFGRYGGVETFDIEFVHDAIRNILRERDDIYFVFLNTREFYSHPRIKYLSGTTNMEIKRKFINTCDALIHARKDGESFGLTCGEFAIAYKPVITFEHSIEKNHIDILGNHAVLYSNYDSVYKILNEFTKNKYCMEGNQYLDHTPENIMKVFAKVFFNESPI